MSLLRIVVAQHCASRSLHKLLTTMRLLQFVPSFVAQKGLDLQDRDWKVQGS